MIASVVIIVVVVAGLYRCVGRSVTRVERVILFVVVFLHCPSLVAVVVFVVSGFVVSFVESEETKVISLRFS